MTSAVTFEDVKTYFHLPSREAAALLGIGTSSLKKICRRNGVQRWPYRKIKSFDHLTSTTPAEAQGPLSPSANRHLRVNCPASSLEPPSPAGVCSPMSHTSASALLDTRELAGRELASPCMERWKYQTQAISPYTLSREAESMATAAAAATLPYNYVPYWEARKSEEVVRYDHERRWDVDPGPRSELKLEFPARVVTSSAHHAHHAHSKPPASASTSESAATPTTAVYSQSDPPPHSAMATPYSGPHWPDAVPATPSTLIHWPLQPSGDPASHHHHHSSMQHHRSNPSS